MPLIIAIREEAAACRLTARWIQSHIAICPDIPFSAFVTHAHQTLPAMGSVQAGIDLLETYARVIAAVGVVGNGDEPLSPAVGLAF
jgi:hypothetical protein